MFKNDDWNAVFVSGVIVSVIKPDGTVEDVHSREDLEDLNERINDERIVEQSEKQRSEKNKTNKDVLRIRGYV
jgi:hypothetical protein